MTNLRVINRSYVKKQIEILKLKNMTFEKIYRMNLLGHESGKERDIKLEIDST